MKTYNQKIQEITDLVVTMKALDEPGLNYLKEQVVKYTQINNETDFNKVITMIINYVFTHAFQEGVVSCLKILRSK